MESINILAISFLIGFISAILPTGPASILIFKNAILRKTKNSINLSLGSAILDSIYCFVGITLAGAFIIRYHKFSLLGDILGSILLMSFGIYLYKSNPPDEKDSLKNLIEIKKFKSFFTGFFVAGLNPFLILSWAGISLFLSSIGLIIINAAWKAILFSISVGLGLFIGSLTMIFIANKFSLKKSDEFITNVVKAVGIFVVCISFIILLKSLFFQKLL